MGKNRTTLRWDRQKATVVAYLTSGPEGDGGREREREGERERAYLTKDCVFCGWIIRRIQMASCRLPWIIWWLRDSDPFLLPKKNLPKAWLKGKFTESPFLFFALSQGPGSKSLVCSAHRLAPGVDWCTVAVVIFLFTSKRENLVLLPLCFEIHIILYYIIYYYILLMVKKWFSVDGPWKQYIDNCYFSIPWLRHRTLEAPHERLDPTPKKTLKQTIYVYIYMM